MTQRHFRFCVAWRSVTSVFMWHDAASLRNQLPTFRKTHWSHTSGRLAVKSWTHSDLIFLFTSVTSVNRKTSPSCWSWPPRQQSLSLNVLACEQDQDVPSWSCSQAVWHKPLLCVQCQTPDDGQRNCPKHVEFYYRNKFEKLVRLVGFIVRGYISVIHYWGISRM